MENQQIESAETNEQTQLSSEPHASNSHATENPQTSETNVETAEGKTSSENLSTSESTQQGAEKSTADQGSAGNPSATTSEEKNSTDVKDDEETKVDEVHNSETVAETVQKPFIKEEFYATYSKETYAKFVELLNTTFDPSPEKDGVKLSWLLEETRGLYYVKAETDIKGSAKTIKEIILNEEKLTDWDKTVDFVKRIEIVNDCKISYSISKKMGMVIEKRDCCVLVKTYEEGNSTIIAGGSFEHPEYPPQNVPVRCEIPVWGWQLVQNGDDQNLTHATYIVLIDPKGWVPKQVLNAACTEQAMNVKSIKNYVEGVKEEKKGMFGFLKKPW